MKYLLAVLNVIAFSGLLLSAGLHFTAWAALAGGASIDDAPIHALAPWVMRLGAVGLPALALGALAAYHAGSRDVLRIVLARCPRWMRIARVALLLYGFGLFVVLGIVWHHEAAPSVAHAVLFGSSLGLAYFGTCAAALYSMLRAPQMLSPRRCSKGHAVKGGDEICPDCGERLEPHADHIPH